MKWLNLFCKQIFIFLLVLTFILFIIGCKEDFGSEEVLYDSEKTYDGLTLFAMNQGMFIYLINMQGEVVHTWNVGTTMPFGKLQEDGTLVYIANSTAQPNQIETTHALIREVDWDNNILWEYKNEFIHHDFSKMPNGNILAIMWEQISDDNKAKLSVNKNKEVWVDYIIEIDYETQEIVWEWHMQDVLEIEKYDYNVSHQLELSHTNAVEYLPVGNSFNGKESIMISSRQLDSIFIIDKTTGNVEWELGPEVLEGQHNPTLLDNGNVLVFNNGKIKSNVLEINPLTNEIVWEYSDDGFYSGHISGAQRLANGNTLICEGADGRIFEVTQDKEIVWEYITPFSKKGKMDIFRAYRYSEDFSGLVEDY